MGGPNGHGRPPGGGNGEASVDGGGGAGGGDGEIRDASCHLIAGGECFGDCTNGEVACSGGVGVYGVGGWESCAVMLIFIFIVVFTAMEQFASFWILRVDVCVEWWTVG